MIPDKNNIAIFQRNEGKKPCIKIGIGLISRVNVMVWFDWPIGVWLCCNPTWDKDEKTGIWTAKYTFQYREGSWAQKAYNTTKEETQIYNIYEYGNFNLLGLTEEDWIPL